tara:strand:+ start:263 stop:946 length:684 start_codon:yes stop_codon:yes gene_type:complete
MICPKCKQKTNHVINTKFFDEFNYLERERECRTHNCFNKFITYEQISPDNKKIPKLKIPKVKIRKTEARTEWKEYRFLNYACMLIVNIMHEFMEYIKKNDLEDKFDQQLIYIKLTKNDAGVIFLELEDETNEVTHKHKCKSSKSNTIKELLMSKTYWNEFRRIFKREASKEDKIKEEENLAKSIIHPESGIKSEKYNLEFFRRNPYIADWIDKIGEKDFWQIWTKLH